MSDLKMAPSLMSLSDEVLSMILRQTATWKPPILSCLNLVNTRLHRLSIGFQYRSLTLTASKLRRLVPGASSLRRNVVMLTRELTVDGGGFDWEPLRQLLTEFDNLLSISWHSWKEAIPAPILDLLRSRFPEIKLHLQELPIPIRQDSPVIGIDVDDFILLDGLDGCRNISSISALLHSEHPIATRRWMDLAASCPNLDVLQLLVPSQDPFYLESERTYAAQGFYLQTADRLPSLRKLVVESNRQSTSLLFIPHTFWKWDKLQHLEISGRQISEFLRKITGQLKNLKTLRVERFQHPYLSFHGDGPDFDTALTSFILHIPTLTELEVINSPTKIPSVIFEHLGIGLQALSFQGLFRQQPRLPYIEEVVPMAFHLDSQDLRDISSLCPNISSLAIDMLVMHEVSYDFLSALSKFAYLKVLRLLVKTVNKDQERCYLYRDVKMVEKMALFLFEEKVGCHLSKIEVMLGTYGNTDDRPGMEFLCYRGNVGQMIVEDNRHEVDAELFRDYLYDGEDVDEWETAMAGADLKMAQLEQNEELGDSLACLFDDSSFSNERNMENE
ncbi:hypothetical protein DL98DRAFT_656810 [Cadophora sp. DSE1049]|nr:hypothetical protein DL98DRAFT_656810 [Cadophora sp. DSE1049]